MIKRLLAGVALGYYGKKLYDEGKLDSVINRVRNAIDEAAGTTPFAAARKDPKASADQPDMAF